jgi:hypothetical protein
MKGAGLTRFSRKRLGGARLEFALACVSHNLRLFLWRRGGVFVAIAVTRRHGAWCCGVIVAIAPHEN